MYRIQNELIWNICLNYKSRLIKLQWHNICSQLSPIKNVWPLFLSHYNVIISTYYSTAITNLSFVLLSGERPDYWPGIFFLFLRLAIVLPWLFDYFNLHYKISCHKKGYASMPPADPFRQDHEEYVSTGILSKRS